MRLSLFLKCKYHCLAGLDWVQPNVWSCWKCCNPKQTNWSWAIGTVILHHTKYVIWGTGVVYTWKVTTQNIRNYASKFYTEELSVAATKLYNIDDRLVTSWSSRITSICQDSPDCIHSEDQMTQGTLTWGVFTKG